MAKSNRKWAIVAAAIIVLAVIAYYAYTVYSTDAIGNYLFSPGYQSTLQKPTIFIDINYTSSTSNAAGLGFPGISIGYRQGNSTGIYATYLYENRTWLRCLYNYTYLQFACAAYNTGYNNIFYVHANDSLIDEGDGYIVSVYENGKLFNSCAAETYHNRIFVRSRSPAFFNVNATFALPNTTNAEICLYAVNLVDGSVNGAAVRWNYQSGT